MEIQKSLKFLCDQMCAELGKWLRAAGYDTLIAESGIPDKELLKRAEQENRRLITRDKFFKEVDPESKITIFLQEEFLDAWVEQLKDQENINWLYHPFSRCLQCNTALDKILSPKDVPEKIQHTVNEFWFCPECQQTFWRGSHTEKMLTQLENWQHGLITIGLGGDLMIGRLVSEHLIHNDPTYVWGNLHQVLKTTDINLVNLETTLTHSKKIRSKVFNFKSEPKNVAVLTQGPIHVVNLANNHILDFSEEGLSETIDTLDLSHIMHVGAGNNLISAQTGVILKKKGIKVGILGCTDNEPSWKATASHPGTYFVEVGDLEALQHSITSLRQEVDLLILSIHWGPNMQRRPSSDFQAFAHQLIDQGVDILHGHSAHVFQGVEVYRNRLILYDTGDLVDDYAVDPELRNDHSFFFIIKANKKGLISLKMIPIHIANFQVNVTKEQEPLEVMDMLCKEFNTHTLRHKHFLEVKFTD